MSRHQQPSLAYSLRANVTRRRATARQTTFSVFPIPNQHRASIMLPIPRDGADGLYPRTRVANNTLELVLPQSH